ncbi:MAG: LysM peptidoglycan-binding domain-containing protein [Anaerohalosphaeraceae bacterium]
MKRWALRMAVAGVALLCAAGCNGKSVRKQNQELTQRVAELENQLEQAEAIIASATANAQTPTTGQPVYTIVAGDTLWGIAQRQLGSGARHKEILALNPHITTNKPLTIGTTLRMPPR